MKNSCNIKNGSKENFREDELNRAFEQHHIEIWALVGEIGIDLLIKLNKILSTRKVHMNGERALLSHFTRKRRSSKLCKLPSDQTYKAYENFCG